MNSDLKEHFDKYSTDTSKFNNLISQLTEEKFNKKIAKKIIMVHYLMIDLLSHHNESSKRIYKSLIKEKNNFISENFLTYDDIIELNLEIENENSLPEIKLLLEEIAWKQEVASPQQYKPIPLAAEKYDGLDDVSELVRGTEYNYMKLQNFLLNL